MTAQVIISIDSISERSLEAAQLSKTYQLPLRTNTPFSIYLNQQHIELRHNPSFNPPPKKATALKPLYLDFMSGSMNHRRQFGGGKGQLIAKAIGLNKYTSPHVVDLTAGLARDAFVLATLGCKVTLLEREAPIYLLLNDALQRSQQSDDLALHRIIDRMYLYHANAVNWLHNYTVQPPVDVIYYDPMYPDLNKSAKAKKEMQWLHQIIGRETTDIINDNNRILTLAKQCVTKRVVVKRARHAPTITNEKPNFQFIGKSTRFDIYLP